MTEQIYRIEHSLRGTGLFTTQFSSIYESEKVILQDCLVNNLMDHYDNYPNDLPSPKEQFLRTIFTNCKTFNSEHYLNEQYIDFTKNIKHYKFGCKSINDIAQWIIFDVDNLEILKKLKYNLYEIEVSHVDYKFDKQILFKQSNVINIKILDLYDTLYNLMC